MGLYVSYIQDVLADVNDRLSELGIPIYPSRPTGKQDQDDCFLVVSIPYGVEDSSFLGTTELRIEVYARNATGGGGVTCHCCRKQQTA